MHCSTCGKESATAECASCRQWWQEALHVIATIHTRDEAWRTDRQTEPPISRAAVDRWLDRQGVAVRLMSDGEIVALAMKHSRGKVDPAMVRQAIRAMLT